jgi:4-amino-4-deoxy-L-arabinose transferase-like glycosyltransferase
VIVVLTFFSIAKGKLALYIMPTYLPASLLAGLTVYRCHSGQASSRGACGVGIVLAVLMMGMLCVGLGHIVSLGASPLVPTIAIGTAFALLGAVAAPVIAREAPVAAAPSCGRVARTATLVAFGALIGGTTGSYVVLNTFVWPFQESRNPLQPVVRAVAPLVTRETPVIVCGYERGWKQMAFYLRRKIIRAHDAEELLEALPAEEAVCVLPIGEMEKLPAEVRARMQPVARFPFPSKARLMRQVENLGPLVDPRYQTTLLVARWEPGPGGRPKSPDAKAPASDAGAMHGSPDARDSALPGPSSAR